MAMEEELRALLASAAGCPVAWVLHPQGTSLPRITLSRVSGVADVTLDGPGGFTSGRVQVDCDGVPGPDLDAVEAAVKSALNGYSGGSIWVAQQIGIRDLSSEEGGDVIQRVSLDFAVTYRE